MKVERRVVWLTDEEWAQVNAICRRRELNPSNLIRMDILNGPKVNLDRFGTPRPAPKPKRADDQATSEGK